MKGFKLRQIDISFRIIILIYCSLAKGQVIKQENHDPWELADKIVASIHEPLFKNKQYIITSYGAIADGIYKCTEAINNAINDCAENGGGIVIVPKGTFLTGPVYLKSNVNLHLEEGAVLRFSTTTTDYLPLILTRWEGVDCYNYSPFINLINDFFTYVFLS